MHCGLMSKQGLAGLLLTRNILALSQDNLLAGIGRLCRIMLEQWDFEIDFPLPSSFRQLATFDHFRTKQASQCADRYNRNMPTLGKLPTSPLK